MIGKRGPQEGKIPLYEAEILDLYEKIKGDLTLGSKTQRHQDDQDRGIADVEPTCGNEDDRQKRAGPGADYRISSDEEDDFDHDAKEISVRVEKLLPE